MVFYTRKCVENNWICFAVDSVGGFRSESLQMSEFRININNSEVPIVKNVSSKQVHEPLKCFNDNMK